MPTGVMEVAQVAPDAIKQEEGAVVDAEGDVDMERGTKRPFGEEPGKKKNKGKKRKVSGPPLPKNALMQLNEIKPGLTFNMVSQTGPVHSPVFTIQVEVNGVTYEGSANTKKGARLACAEKALDSFVQHANASQAHAALGKGTQFTQGTDFTSDEGFGNFENKPQNQIKAEPGAPTNGAAAAAAAAGQKTPQQVPPQPAGKNPVMILNEIRPGTKYDFVNEQGESHAKVFIMSVTVDNETFQGTGRNKRLAKTRAAQAALQKIFNLEFAASPDEDQTPTYLGSDESYACFKPVMEKQPKKPKKKNSTPDPNQVKLPLQEIAELVTETLEFECTQSSLTPNNSIMNCKLMLRGTLYEGTGKNKKEAKHACATAALQALKEAGTYDLLVQAQMIRRTARKEKEWQHAQRQFNMNRSGGQSQMQPKPSYTPKSTGPVYTTPTQFQPGGTLYDPTAAAATYQTAAATPAAAGWNQHSTDWTQQTTGMNYGY